MTSTWKEAADHAFKAFSETRANWVSARHPSVKRMALKYMTSWIVRSDRLDALDIKYQGIDRMIKKRIGK